MLHSILHQLCHLLCKARHAHSSTVNCGAPNSRPLPHLGCGVHNLLHKGVVDPLLDKEALCTSAVLPTAEEGSLQGNRHCLQRNMLRRPGDFADGKGVGVVCWRKGEITDVLLGLLPDGLHGP